jgi:hypothetical protein
MESWTRLDEAILTGNLTQVELLLTNGANPNQQGWQLPLSSAAMCEHADSADVLAALIHHGADINARLGEALELACTHCIVPNIYELLERGASPLRMLLRYMEACYENNVSCPQLRVMANTRVVQMILQQDVFLARKMSRLLTLPRGVVEIEGRR